MLLTYVCFTLSAEELGMWGSLIWEYNIFTLWVYHIPIYNKLLLVVPVLSQWPCSLRRTALNSYSGIQ